MEAEVKMEGKWKGSGGKIKRTTIFGNDRLGFFKTTLLPKRSKILRNQKPKTLK